MNGLAEEGILYTPVTEVRAARALRQPRPVPAAAAAAGSRPATEEERRAKDKGKKTQIGDRAVGWLEALEPGKNLVLDAPWELHVAKEMGTAAAILNKKKGDGERDSERFFFSR